MSGLAPHVAVRARAALVAVLAVALFVEVNVLSARHSSAADWSRGRIYTLSDRTRQVLRTLDRGVTLTAIVSETAEARGAGRAETLRRLLERYAAASRRVAVRQLDPDRDPVEVATVRSSSAGPGGAAAFRTAGDASRLSVLVRSGDRTAFRTLDELFPPPVDGDRSSTAPLAVEAGVTGAIVDVTSPERPVICLTTGHGEWDLAGPEGELLLRGALEGDAYDVRTLEPSGTAEELERCVVTAIVGPSRGFLPREAAALRSRLEQGGRLLVLFDASVGVGGDASKGLETLLARAGLEVGAAPARETDPSRLYEPGVPTLVVASVGEAFAPARDLAGRPVAVLQAAGVRAIAETAGVLPVIESAESTVIDGWGGGAFLGAAAEVGEGGRIVVLGASSILFPPFAARPQTANLALVLASTAWLAGRSTVLPPTPVRAERVRLFLDAGALHRLWWWLVVAMPVGAAVGGVIVGRVRRGGRGGSGGSGGPTRPLTR